jgi:hypothetical protein
VKLVQTLVVRGEADLLDAQIAYHLSAGVDFVIASVSRSAEATSDVLKRYESGGHLRLLPEEAPSRVDVRTHMARLAATEHEADWVINSEPGEFWWPRAENLKDVLAPIPPRYTIVQALRRPFLSRQGAGRFSERMTVRRSLREGEAMPGSPATLLRPLHRADPRVVVHADGTVELPRTVPLRAWYPIEVFDFSGDEAEDEIPDDSLVDDTRLRDVLRALGVGGESTVALSVRSENGLVFPVPDVVEDASYAVECAAVGEVDLPRLEQYITDLEQRIDWLEQRFWPRVLRRVARIAGRS